MIPDGNKGLNEDLESVIRFGGVWRIEVIVDLFSCSFGEESLAIKEASVLDVEVDVAKCDC